MPRETVYGDNVPYGTKDDPGPARAVTELTWSRERGHVQIVTKCVAADTGMDYVPPVVAVTTTADFDVTTFPAIDARQGFYVDLDRQGINKLIRNLRRARDQAFGRDE